MATTPKRKVPIIDPDPYMLESACEETFGGAKIMNPITKVYEYAFKIKKEANTITVVPPDLSFSERHWNTLYNVLQQRYPKTTFEKSKKGTVFKIKAIKYGRGLIEIQGPRRMSSLPIPNWKLYEFYFNSLIRERLNILRESAYDSEVHIRRWPAVTLMIKLANKKNAFPIGPIIDTRLTAGGNKKTDVRLTKKDGSKVNISLKMENFSYWSSAHTKNSSYTDKYKDILEAAIQQNKAQTLPGNKNIIDSFGNASGISYKVESDDEIRYYCFGEGADEVDYVIVHGYGVSYDEVYHILDINASMVYRNNNAADFKKIKDDIYAVIQKGDEESNPSSLHPYRRVSLRYVNSAHINNSNYIEAKIVNNNIIFS